jgi:hypothetical protein
MFARFPLETPLVLDMFGDFIPKEDKFEPRQAMCEHSKRRSKRGSMI